MRRFLWFLVSVSLMRVGFVGVLGVVGCGGGAKQDGGVDAGFDAGSGAFDGGFDAGRDGGNAGFDAGLICPAAQVPAPFDAGFLDEADGGNGASCSGGVMVLGPLYARAATTLEIPREWTQLGAIRGADGVFASISLDGGDFSPALELSGFDFPVSDDAGVMGVTAELVVHGTSPSLQLASLSWMGGSTAKAVRELHREIPMNWSSWSHGVISPPNTYFWGADANHPTFFVRLDFNQACTTVPGGRIEIDDVLVSIHVPGDGGVLPITRRPATVRSQPLRRVWARVSSATGAPNAAEDGGAALVSGMSQGETTDAIILSDFGFQLPPNASVRGVVAVPYRGGTANVPLALYDARLVKGGVPVGEMRRPHSATSQSWWAGTDPLGDRNDTWGNLLSATEVNAADFGVALRAQYRGVTGTADAELDAAALYIIAHCQ